MQPQTASRVSKATQGTVTAALATAPESVLGGTVPR